MPIKQLNTAERVKARLAECADLESSKPEWTEMALRVLKHFVNTSKVTLVMAMNDGIDSDDTLNMGDENDVLEKVQFAMWRLPSKTPFKLLSGQSSSGSMSNLALLNKFLVSNGLDLVVETVNGQTYLSLSTDPRLFSPSAVL
jgi:hypothetical protein